jgi:hypothetical protein
VEGFAGEIWTVNMIRIENVAKFITGKTINTYLFKPYPTPSYSDPRFYFLTPALPFCLIIGLLTLSFTLLPTVHPEHVTHSSVK